VFALKHTLQASDDTPDRELIAAILQGSEPAFETLIDRYKDRVFRLLSRYCRDAIECEDLAQEVFLKVFRKLHTFQHDSAFFTWLYRIAANAATDHLSRAGRRRLRLVEDEEVLDSTHSSRSAYDEASNSPSAPLLAAELAAVTRKIVDALPEKYRTILILREFEDLSYNEIAEVLQCNLGTVESRLFRARQRFKEQLERTHPDLVPQVSVAFTPRHPSPAGRGGNR
jgi:RNA polymerase sigma-70 factor (ECF subfamily)